MASTFISSAGFSSGFCEIKTTTFCNLRTIIDAINSIFAILFLMLLLMSSINKQHRVPSRKATLMRRLASLACAIVSSAYFGFGAITVLLEKEGPSSHSHWQLLAYITRGFIWCCLAISSFIQGSKWATILTSFWSILFFILMSALNIYTILKKQDMGTGSSTIDTLLWPLNLLLLLCAFKDLKDLTQDNHPADNLVLSEPFITNGQSDSEQTRDEKHIGFFSRLTFSWINPLLRLGYSKPLVLTDIPPLCSEDEAGSAYQRFTEAWESLRLHINKSNNTSTTNSKVGNLVIKALTRVYLKDMVFIGIGALIKILTTVATPLLLYAFIEYTKSKEEEDKKNLYNGMLLLGLLVLVKCAESLSQRHWFFQARQTGMRMRSALMVAVYQKQLRLSSSGKKRHSTGEIVNYIGVDAYRMGDLPWWLHYFWSMVLLLFLGIGVLFFIMGSGALFGLLPLFICIFLNAPFTKWNP